MGIVLAVKKGDTICIAADTMTISGGSRKQTAAHVINSEKIIEWGDSYVGVVAHPVWQLVLKDYFCGVKKKPHLGSREEIFNELLRLHGVLKEKYHLVSNDDDDAFESSRFESLIVNSQGIFKTYELRSVSQFIRFAAIGSGAQYALGALEAVYERLSSAEEIAQVALRVAAEFDDSSGLPGTFYTIQSL